MAPQTGQNLEFGPYRLDREQQLLFRGSEIITLAPRIYETLLALVESGGRVVDKEDLLRRVWQDAFVEEGSLARNVSTLRKILGESPQDRKYIVTVPKRGYRFAARVTAGAALDRQTADLERSTAIPFGAGDPVSRQTAQKLAPTLVGRDLERKRLQEHLESMLAGGGKLIFLTGEAGMGKSSLAEQFMNSVRRTHPELRIATGNAVEQYGPGESYLPFLDALSELLREHGNQVSQHLRSHAPTWYLQLPAFTAGAEMESLRSETAGATKERMLREMGDVLGAIATDAPLLLLLEDLHWADGSTVDLLRHLSHRVRTQRVLLLATVRPEDIRITKHPLNDWAADMKARQLCDEIELGALNAEDVRNLLRQRFSPHQFPDEFASLIWKRTEGHPLFTVSLLDFLAGSGDIVHNGAAWDLASPPAQMVRKIPESVRAMIRQKSEALEPGARLALQYASVEGEEFLSSVVARLLDIEQLRAEEELASLAQTQRLIRVRGEEELPDGALATRYAFVHALYQNVFYEELVGARRTQLHAIAGEQLLRHYGDRAPRIAGQLAMHFERGRDWTRAIEFLLIAGDNARSMYANSQAEEHYSHALDLSARLPESIGAEIQFRIFEKRASVYLSASRFDLSIADCREMIQRARATGSVERECAALYILGNTLFWAHRLTEMQSTLEEVLRLTATEAGRLRAFTLMAQGHLASGDLSAADDNLRTVVGCSSSLDKKALLDSLDVRARLSFFRSEYGDAEQMFREKLDLALDLGDAFEFLKSNYFLGLTLANSGRISEALGVLSRATETAKRNDEIFWLSRVPNAFGWIHREIQDFEGAEVFDREGAAISHRAGFGEAEVNSVINLAMDHLQSKDPAGACSAMEAAESLLSQDAWFRWRFEMRLLQARAERTLARADGIALLDKATQHGAQKYIVIARTLLARIAMLGGDIGTAAEEISSACAILERYPAPLRAWQAHSMRGRIEMRRGNREAGIAAYREAAAIIRYVSDHIDDERLRNIFLSSDAVCGVLGEARELLCSGPETEVESHC